MENYIYYYYDESGVCGMNYNGTEYYYRKNILGDVIAIYDSLGNFQCKYVYDAWGNHKVYNASGSEIGAEVLNIGNINSIRYRGYYWDSEFSLYYLQSRYYDPALGRFISPDDVSYLDPENIIGFNLYAYCGDNPIMNVDPEGTWSWGKFWDIFTTVGSVIAGVTVGISVGITTDNIFFGIMAGVSTFKIINNAVNAIYYACSDGQSALDGASYNYGYITRWDRLDYAKQQTGQKNYFSHATESGRKREKRGNREFPAIAPSALF